MVRISAYDLKEVEINGDMVYWVIRLESVKCPVCSGVLSCESRRTRKLIAITGVKILMICRLWCDKCKKIHHELPECIIPYKRHAGKDIEVALASEPIGSCAENSTIVRWRKWFEYNAVNWLGKIASLLPNKKVSPNLAIMERLKQYVGLETGWLCKVVRMAAN
jgi:hypothetical protein